MPFAALEPWRFFLLEPELRRKISEDGFVVIENFMDENDFRAIREEIYAKLDALPRTTAEAAKGFGKKAYRKDGFDRYDGGSLNRFVTIAEDSAVKRFLKHPQLNRLSLALFGMFNHRKKYHIYELIHGDESINPDIQKQTHKDTFHHTYKLWYFVDDVTAENGPFEYFSGSHRSTWKRLVWEYGMSCKISTENHLNKGGSFRISDQDLQHLQFPVPAALFVKANSLVMADTKGFHRRGMAPTGSRRIGVYANFRPRAFLPFPH
jgi:hypothetical protein